MLRRECVSRECARRECVRPGNGSRKCVRGELAKVPGTQVLDLPLYFRQLLGWRQAIIVGALRFTGNFEAAGESPRTQECSEDMFGGLQK